MADSLFRDNVDKPFLVHVDENWNLELEMSKSPTHDEEFMGSDGSDADQIHGRERDDLVSIKQPLTEHATNLDSFRSQQSRRNTSTNEVHSLQTYLCMVPHLCTLSTEELGSLSIMVREFAALDTVVEYGSSVQHVYVVAHGTVEVFNTRSGSTMTMHKRVSSITAPNVFGIDSAVFDVPSEFIMRAGSARTTLLLIPKMEFLALLPKNRTFAHSVGHKMVDHIQIFSVFQEFCRSIFAKSSAVEHQNDSVIHGYSLSMPDILESYMKLESVIHPLRKSPQIDFRAWKYALRRLPYNITDTFVLNLARSLPPYLANEIRESLEEDALSISASRTTPVALVETSHRRRLSWNIGDRGNILVLLREGFTDVIDFITCFCIHLVESRKLRLRLQSMVFPSVLDVIRRALSTISDNNDTTQIEQAEATALPLFPLSHEEQKGLLSLWPHNCLQQLYNVVMHREEVVVKIDTSLTKRFDVDPYLQWAITLRRQVLVSLGLSEIDPIPDDVIIDIFSSNTHTTKNLLCSFAIKYKNELIEWGRIHREDVIKATWTQEEDMLYFLFGARMVAEGYRKEEYRDTLRKCGFVVVEDTSMTGLQVEIINVKKLDKDLIDPVLHSAFAKGRERGDSDSRFILNMDFAFGAQADGIIRALFLTFGQSIRSLNVVGKAGGMQGKIGDVQLPTHLLFSKAGLGEDSMDEIRKVSSDLKIDRLRELLPGRAIHEGTVITIPGTVLENVTLLKYYKYIYGCIGLEREGSYYARQVEESANLGLIRDDIVGRYAYYTNDLAPKVRMDVPLKPTEGVPPLYAIGRAMLELIL